jgi:ECF transporter S component (folate family)
VAVIVIKKRKGAIFLKKNTLAIVFTGLLIALNIVLDRFLSLQWEILRISLGFLPIVLAGFMFGPVYAGAAGALSDVLGMMIFPKGAYFPGFTFTALVGGVIYGLMLYKKKVTIPRVAVTMLLSSVICDMLLNTYWLHVLYNTNVYVLIYTRVLAILIMYVVEVFLVYITARVVIRYKLVK